MRRWTKGKARAAGDEVWLKLLILCRKISRNSSSCETYRIQSHEHLLSRLIKASHWPKQKIWKSNSIQVTVIPVLPTVDNDERGFQSLCKVHWHLTSTPSEFNASRILMRSTFYTHSSISSIDTHQDDPISVQFSHSYVTNLFHRDFST